MKYQKGDIVEIVTAKYTKFSDISGWDFNNYSCLRDYPPIIGQRFIVKSVVEEHNGKIRLDSEVDGLSAYSNCVMLYHRPKETNL